MIDKDIDKQGGDTGLQALQVGDTESQVPNGGDAGLQALKGGDTESQILRAAEQEFLQKGFAGARTTEIAKAAGVTHGMLHYYFRTKEKLFEKILAEKMGLLKSLMAKSIIEKKLSLQDRLRRVIEVHFDFLASNPGLPRFFLDEIISKPERRELLMNGLRQNAPELVNAFKRDIERGVEEGICRPVDLRLLFINIVSLNVFPFLAAPLLEGMFPEFGDNREGYIEGLKRENFETIWRKISLK